MNTKTEETQETALTLACCGGFFECVEVILKAGADIEAGSSTPIMEAAQEGHFDLVKYLHEQGTCIVLADCVYAFAVLLQLLVTITRHDRLHFFFF